MAPASSVTSTAAVERLEQQAVAEHLRRLRLPEAARAARWRRSRCSALALERYRPPAPRGCRRPGRCRRSRISVSTCAPREAGARSIVHQHPVVVGADFAAMARRPLATLSARVAPPQRSTRSLRPGRPANRNRCHVGHRRAPARRRRARCPAPQHSAASAWRIIGRPSSGRYCLGSVGTHAGTAAGGRNERNSRSWRDSIRMSAIQSDHEPVRASIAVEHVRGLRHQPGASAC